MSGRAADEARGRASILAAGVGKHIVVFAALVAAWEIAAALGMIDLVLLPPPHAIAAGILELYVLERTIYGHFLLTFYQAFAGFLIGALLGLALAVGSAVNLGFRRYVSPYAILLNVTPGLALTPIVIAWFGFGNGSKIALGAIVCFFPVFVNTLTGLTRTDAETREMFLSLGASRSEMFWKLQVPQAMPIVFAGFKIAITTALVGAIVAQFSQGTAGIGVLMQRLAFRLDMASALAALLSMSLLGLLLFTIIEILDDRLVYWRRDARMERVGRKRAALWSSLLENDRTDMARRRNA